LNYKVLVKNKKIYFTPNNVIYSIYFICLIPLSIQYFLFKNNDFYWFDYIFFGIFFLCLIASIFFSFYNLFRFEIPEGELIGNLEFKNNEIIINSQNFPLEIIKKIELQTYDYKGRIIAYRGNLNGTKSIGARNELIITLQNNEIKKVYFQQLYKGQISEEKEFLIDYCNQGKMYYINLLDNLGITDYKEIQIFKKTFLNQFK